MATLTVPKGISSATVIDVPDQWSPEWFRRFIRTQLAQADVRNSVVGSGIVINGSPVMPATIDVSNVVKSLFHEPYVLATAPTDTALDKYRTIAAQAGVLTITDGGAANPLTVGVAANGIGNPQLRQAIALSVIGNATNASTNVADIAATGDGQLLRQSGATLGFGTVKIADTTGLGNSFTTSGLVAGQVLRASGATAAAFAQLNFSDLAGTAALGQLPPYPAAANPTASVGLSAVNGSAATFMRSDGAPALSQAIAPTWTGLHTWLQNLGVFSATGNPMLKIVNTNSTAQTPVDFFSNTSTLTGRIRNDWAGNMNYASFLSGTHDFYVGGDSSVGVLSFAINSGKVNFAGHATTTTAPAAGGAGALPATPKGYVTLQVNGVDQKLAFY